FLRARHGETLPQTLDQLRTDILTLSEDPSADALAETLYQDGLVALEAREANTAKQMIADLEVLKSDLSRTYEVRIRYRDGAQSGIYRIPNDAPQQRNYYLLVEAVDPRGNIVEVPVRSEETQTPHRVTKWGQRVSQSVFNRIAADKTDDQIIQNDVIGEKASGQLQPTYSVDTPGGVIIDW
ncbi:MAG: DUF6384 family protein, partial [Pseudomonadota bacterium]